MIETFQCMQIADVFVGSSRNTLLDCTDASLALAPVVIQFGQYLKVLVTLQECDAPMSTDTAEVGPCVFDVMQQAMCEQSRARTPPLIQECNGNDRLYNGVLENLKQRGLQWRPDEVESSGVNFVKSLTEVLWYIDGHHSTLSSRGFLIPPSFASFQGYNIPELSKHRKRTLSNMSRDALHALAQKMFRLLQANYFM